MGFPEESHQHHQQRTILFAAFGRKKQRVANHAERSGQDAETSGGCRKRHAVSHNEFRTSCLTPKGLPQSRLSSMAASSTEARARSTCQSA